jgi:hypothetical protein
MKREFHYSTELNDVKAPVRVHVTLEEVFDGVEVVIENKETGVYERLLTIHHDGRIVMEPIDNPDSFNFNLDRSDFPIVLNNTNRRRRK